MRNINNCVLFVAKVGVLAAACQVGLQDFLTSDMLHKDHKRAQYLATALQSLEGFRVDTSAVQSNIIVVEVTSTAITAPEVSKRLKETGILINDR